jgi:hypothetical protein
MAATVLEIEILLPPLLAQLPNPETPETEICGKTDGVPAMARLLRPT